MTMDFSRPDPPAPTPLRAARVPAPFPVGVLPDWAREWVAAEAVATQTPPDLAGCCLLGVLSAAAGGRAVVQPRIGWHEPVNLYLLPVMPPGSRKSAVISAATRALYAAEEALVDQVKAKITEAATLRDIAAKAASKAQQEAVNAPADMRKGKAEEAVSLARAAEDVEVPPLPRLIADDVTPEAVGSLLADQGGRLAIISAEGGIFETMGGRYSNGVPVLDVWLKGHAGDPLRVDRKGRASEYVRSPALTLLLTVQPSVLGGIARNGTFRGRGLTARFLYTLPPDNIGRREIGAAPVPEDVTTAYEKKVQELVEGMVDWTDPAILPLTNSAHDLLLDFERAIEPKLARDGDLGAVREWASKLVGATLRIAGLLHLADDAGGFRRPISVETLQAAIRLGEYFIDHAKAAFDLLGDGGTSDALYLLEYLRRKELATFTIRKLTTDLPRGRFGTKDDVEAAVDVLLAAGWVVADEPQPARTGPGRPPSPKFQCHPHVLDDAMPFTAVEVSAESAVSAEPPPAQGSADTADNAETSTTSECFLCARPDVICADHEWLLADDDGSAA